MFGTDRLLRSIGALSVEVLAEQTAWEVVILVAV